MIKGFIFDLDGVIVDTAKYHYLAWRRLANGLGFDLTEEQNEQLKGVSRMASLEYILKLGNVELTDIEKEKYAFAKNEQYVQLLDNLSGDDILPGIYDLLHEIKDAGLGLALGSASKNSKTILTRLNLIDLFDVISDGNSTTKSKPDPEVFLIAAKGLNLPSKNCLVIEDSIKGVEAALAGEFMALGIGEQQHLGAAHHVLSDLGDTNLEALQNLYT